MNDLIKVCQRRDLETPFNTVLEWRLKLKGEEYGAAISIDASKLLLNPHLQDNVIESFVRQMDDSVQKILHGETRTEMHMREIKSVYERFANAFVQR